MKKIFDNHYFSNHWEFAKKLEKEIIKLTGYKHCITYGSYYILLQSVMLLLQKDNQLLLSNNQPIIKKMLKFAKMQTKVTSQKNKKKIVCFIFENKELEIRKGIKKIYVNSITPLEKSKKKIDRILDLGLMSKFGLIDGAIYCTNDKLLADNLRSMRSSYGLSNKKAKPIILGNGRFSEFQAYKALENFYSKNNKNRFLLKKFFKNQKVIAIDQNEFGICNLKFKLVNDLTKTFGVDDLRYYLWKTLGAM